MENRNALIVDAELAAATGFAERDCRLPERKRRRRMAPDKGYDTKDFVAKTRQLGFTPHVAQNTTNRRSVIDGRITRHTGHQVSQRIRKRVEEPFGWIKTIGGGRKLRYSGQQRNRAWFKIEATVYNLIRITALDAPPPVKTPREVDETAHRTNNSTPSDPAGDLSQAHPLRARFSAPC